MPRFAPLQLLVVSLVMVLAPTSTVIAGSSGPDIPPAYTPEYAYSPSEVGGDGSTVSLAIVSPAYSDALLTSLNITSRPTVADDEYLAALERSLLDYFTTNKFAVSGPFKSVDDMTFPEKKQSDLVLEITVDVRPPDPNSELKTRIGRNAWSGDRTVWSADTEIGYRGAIQFTLWEPLSMQRMWTKSIDVSGSKVPLEFDETDSVDLVNRLWANALNRASDLAFDHTMGQVERFFHPDEIRLVKEQSKEIRDSKVY